MKQILWFRRDLRISDSAILAAAKDEVLPIFIFDKNILDNLQQDDKRISFIFDAVSKLKLELKTLNLDLAIFYGEPVEIFEELKKSNFDEILTSVDFDSYAKKRDEQISNILPIKTFFDSWLVHPNDTLKSDGTPYRVFTPYYKSLKDGFCHIFEEFHVSKNLKLISHPQFEQTLSLEDLGFLRQKLPDFLHKNPFEILEDFKSKIDEYEINRDFFYLDGTSNLSVFLRFGIISPKQILNVLNSWSKEGKQIEIFKKELFWREFYNAILFHFPQSEFANFNGKQVAWRENNSDFEAWCEGKTGVPIIDAAMRCLNQTGLMPNRLRMVSASFLTKNLLIDWRLGEAYFAKKLLDYEASSNIGSWQWAASTGADAVPYFRVFSPYAQQAKFDSKNIFINKYISKEELILPIVDVKYSAKRAIEAFAKAKE